MRIEAVCQLGTRHTAAAMVLVWDVVKRPREPVARIARVLDVGEDEATGLLSDIAVALTW